MTTGNEKNPRFMGFACIVRRLSVVMLGDVKETQSYTLATPSVVLMQTVPGSTYEPPARSFTRLARCSAFSEVTKLANGSTVPDSVTR